MEKIEIEALLTEKGIRPTSNRILVLREFYNSRHPLSLSDIEGRLETMDKASIYRVLELLAERELVHVIDDGSRSLKYEVCCNHAHHSVFDEHVHFYCERCSEIFCFEEVKVPEIDTPTGFKVKGVNFVLKGLCPKCSCK